MERKATSQGQGKRSQLRTRSGGKSDTAGKSDARSIAGSATPPPHDPVRESGMEQGSEGNKSQRRQEDKIGTDEDRSLD
jgi:hypothetical protein